MVTRRLVPTYPSRLYQESCLDTCHVTCIHLILFFFNSKTLNFLLNFQGDSGGPLICKDPLSQKDVLAGVVSGSREGSGTFFTRVSSFSKFVQRGRGCGVRSNIIVIVELMCLLRCNIAVLILFDSSKSELKYSSIK